MSDGYILLYRKAEDNPVLQCEQFDRFHAWVWLVEKANFKRVTIPFDGGYKTLQRGQLLTSGRQLSKAWGWGRNRVRTFLELLQKNGMITTSRASNGTIITIENYSVYQVASTTSDTTSGATNDTTNGATNEAQDNKKERGHGQHRSDDRASAPYNDPRYYDIDPGEPEPW